jgi:hypothetical protein
MFIWQHCARTLQHVVFKELKPVPIRQNVFSSSIREITRQRKIPLRAQNSAQWKTGLRFAATKGGNMMVT